MFNNCWLPPAFQRDLQRLSALTPGALTHLFIGNLLECCGLLGWRNEGVKRWPRKREEPRTREKSQTQWQALVIPVLGGQRRHWPASLAFFEVPD